MEDVCISYSFACSVRGHLVSSTCENSKPGELAVPTALMLILGVHDSTQFPSLSSKTIKKDFCFSTWSKQGSLQHRYV